MDVLLSAAAIIVAVIILYRELPRPVEPIFLSGDALSDNALKYKLTAAGGTYAATERGGGIKTGRTAKYLLRELLYISEKSEQANNFERTLLLNDDVIARAVETFRRHLRYSYLIGHVGAPRLYLFCKELVKGSGGYLTENRIADCIAAFEKKTAFTTNEIILFPAMLSFCLCGYICRFAKEAREVNNVYKKGCSDGDLGRVDISETSADYYCGVIDGTKNDKQAIKSFVEQYFDIEEIAEARKEKAAFAAASVERACRSLRVVLTSGGRLESAFSVIKALHRIDGYAYDVLKKHDALIAVSRYAFAKGINEESAVEEIIESGIGDRAEAVRQGLTTFKEKLKYRLSAFIVPPIKFALEELTLDDPVSFDELRYFGGDTAYGVSLIRSKNIFMTCDSFGEVNINRYADTSGAKKFRLNVSAVTDGGKISLCNCDCAFTRGRAVYRAVTDGIEFSVELTAGDMFDNVAVRASVVNRGNADIRGAINFSLTFSETERLSDVDGVETCACFIAKDCAFGLFSPKSAEGEVTEKTVGLTVPVNVGAKSKCAAVAFAFFSADADELFRRAAFVNKDFFDFLALGASAFMAERPDYSYLAKNLRGDFDCAEGAGDLYRPTLLLNGEDADGFIAKVRELRRYGLKFNAVAVDDRFSVPTGRDGSRIVYPSDITVVSDGDTAEKVKRIAVSVSDDYCFTDNENRFIYGKANILKSDKNGSQDSDGDFTSDGELICDKDDAGGRYGYLCDGDVFAEVRCGVVNCYCRAGISVSDVFVAASDGGGISLFDDYTVHSSGYSVMMGALGRVKVYRSGGRSMIFDVRLTNDDSEDKTYTVMFAASPSGGSYKVVPTERGVVALSKAGGDGFALFSDGEIAETTAYREGFFAHGNLERVGGFKKGGVVFYPAISVKRTVPAHGKCRALFALSFKVGELIAGGISASDADRAFNALRKKYKNLSDVTLLSGDRRLNDVFSLSVTRAYALGLFNKMFGGENYFEQSVETLEKAAIKKMDGGSGGLFTLVCACKLFKAGDSSGAYDAIKKYVYDYATHEKADGLTSALFCAVIKRLFLGIMYCGKKARFEPKVCDGAPHIEFLLISGDGSSHIIVSDERGDGDWFTGIGRVTYQSNIIDIGAHSEPIRLFQRRRGA